MEKAGLDLKRKLSIKTQLGYGFGQIADTAAYDWVTCFFIYFLTDFAGINPAFAGIIIMISVIWDGITDPLIGTWSDMCKSKYGRRRPFLIGSCLPLTISMILMFKVMPFEETIAGIYYLVLSLIFWAAYTAFSVPYYCLGVALTFDEDERTKLRGFGTSIGYFGGILATFLPLFAIGFLEDTGLSEADSWFWAGVFLGILSLISIYVTWRSTRGKEILYKGEDEDDEDDNEFNFKLVWQVLKPRVVVLFFLFTFLDDASYAITNSSVMYFTESILGIGEYEASFIYLVNGVTGMVVAIWLSKLALRYDKKYLFLIFATICSLSEVIAYFIGIDSLLDACVLEFVYTIGAAAGWLFTWAFIYDLTEIEEFKSGKRREGIYMSYNSLVVKLGAAFGSLLSGLILAQAGYDGAVEGALQTPVVEETIIRMYTIYPGALGLVALIFMILYPVNKKRYSLLIENLELKRAGKEYTTEGFEELLK